MNIRQLRLLSLIKAVGGEFSGKKRLHKTVYIAQRLGYPFDEEFRWHDYGPYSPVLGLEMLELTEAGLVEATAKQSGAYPETSYRLTPAGEQALATFSPAKTGESAIDRLASELQKKRTGRDLELVASIMYWEAHGHTRQDSIHRVLELKPQYKGDSKALLKAMKDMEAIATYRRPETGATA